jgi:hypothetical protein
MDRLARSVSHLIAVNDAINAKGAHLHILDFGMDTSTSTGRLMLNVLASVAQFEREVMLERQREGIAKAKAEGKYKGRKPTARAKTDDVISLRKRGVGATDIAKRLGIGRASVYRILADVSDGEGASQYRATCSPTSCAASTGSDRRQSRHDERAVPHACRSRARCVRNAARAAISNANTSHWLSIPWFGTKMVAKHRCVAS